jgi:extracellular elastinolytic metalloproteinase
VAFNGPDFTSLGCGPNSAIDQLLGNVDPGSTCGDGGSASTKDWKMETSTDGTRFVLAASGTFGPADQHRLNLVTLTTSATGVSYVRFTKISPQLPGDPATLCPGPFAGCTLLDLSELEVYGPPSA